MEVMAGLTFKQAKEFYSGKRVLVTGHTGFKGAWLCLVLDQLGAIVRGVALDPTYPDGIYDKCKISSIIDSDIRCDIRDIDQLTSVVDDFKPELVFHLAAQPIVLDSYRFPADTFEINVQGSVNLMEAVRRAASAKSIIMVTSDKCYKNQEWTWGYRETDVLGGYDPYSASKAAAEIVISSYRDSFFQSAGTSVCSVRAGNVIGGGDWAKNRIVPDAIRAAIKREKLIIRNPSSIRPWQHVLEPLWGYLSLAMLAYGDMSYSGAWNFAPNPTNYQDVEALINKLCEFLPGLGYEVRKSPDQPKETVFLYLDASKARNKMGWIPRYDFGKTIQVTADWYAHCNDSDILRFTLSQISEFFSYED